MSFYTYLWLRNSNGTFPAGTPYYVGKGKGDRAFFKYDRPINPPTDKHLILLQEFLSEVEAFEAEQFLIAYYGRIDQGTGCLRNLTDGGEGATLSKEIREKISRTKTGTKSPWSKERKEAYTPWNKGKSGSQKAWNKGRSPSAETRRKMSEAKKVFLQSSAGQEQLKRQVVAMTSKEPWNKGKQGLQVAWNKGKKMSVESCLKMSEAKKRRNDAETNTRTKSGSNPS